MKYQTISLKQFYPAKGAIYYVAIGTVIFSHVKITCYFHVWRYHVFARKLTWYFIGVHIINIYISILAISIYASGTRTLLHHNLNWISRVRESSMVTATHIQSVSSPTIRGKDLQFEWSVFSYGKQHHGQSAMMLEQFSWWDKLARSNSKVGSVIDSADLYISSYSARKHITIIKLLYF